MNKLNIVIPMAGAGSRFTQQGFKTAKPFIEFQGKMMIEHVLDSINLPEMPHYLLIQNEFNQIYKQQLFKLSSTHNVQFFSVDRLTQGASCTVLSMHKIINNSSPLLIIDSDNLYTQRVIINFINYALKQNLDGSLLTFKSNVPIYSYVLLDENQLAIDIKEKEVISNNAICGAYYFRQGIDFVDETIDRLIYSEKQKGEYYISGTYQSMIAKNKKIGIYNIDALDWNCVGTPEQLKIYLNKD